MLQNPISLSSLVTPVQQEKVEYHGRCNGYRVEEGQFLKIETGPNGTELLDVGPLAGKRWEATIAIDIKEFDA